VVTLSSLITDVGSSISSLLLPHEGLVLVLSSLLSRELLLGELAGGVGVAVELA